MSFEDAKPVLSVESTAKVDQLVDMVKVMRLEPGDVVVLKSDKLVMQYDAPEMLQRASQGISKFVGFRVTVMVIPSEAEVEVLRTGNGTTLKPHHEALTKSQEKVPMSAPGSAFNVIKASTGICPVCKETQFDTPAGLACRNGHGF